MSIEVAAIVPTVRPAMLETLLNLWGECESTRDIPVIVMAQREPKSEFTAVLDRCRVPIRTFKYRDSGGPVWPVRVRAMLADREVETFINLDDDMQPIPGKTNYAPAIERSKERGVGVVACHWVRSLADAENPRFTEGAQWITQSLVNMAGGQVYGRHVVELMTETASTPWMFDDIQAGLVAYLAGYQNYRYRGSILVHRILSPGGLKRAFSEIPHTPPDSRWINVRRCEPVYEGAADVNNNYMPASSDLTRQAIWQHEKAREVLMAES